MRKKHTQSVQVHSILCTFIMAPVFSTRTQGGHNCCKTGSEKDESGRGGGSIRGLGGALRERKQHVKPVAWQWCTIVMPTAIRPVSFIPHSQSCWHLRQMTCWHDGAEGECAGIPGWGNAESEIYQSQNVEVKNGNLYITAKRDMGYYSSGKIKTQGLRYFNPRMGKNGVRVEGRMQFPLGMRLSNPRQCAREV